MTQLAETEMTWARTGQDLHDTFRKWGVSKYTVSCLGSTRPTSRTLPIAERAVTIRFFHPDGREIVLHKDDWERANDNFRQLYHGLEAMRVIWNKGLENTIRTAYMQLAAPETQRDPFEVLGVRPDAPMEDIEDMFKIKAKRAHPDAGGTEAAMVELNAAIERIRAERVVSA